MSNMSYCRFENTYRDLEDCRYALQAMVDGQEDDGDPTEPLSTSELGYAQLLLDSVLEIAATLQEAGFDLDDPRNTGKAAEWLEELNARLADAKKRGD